MRVRKTISVAVLMAAAPALSGCAGFLVPAGEGEPGPEPSRAAVERPADPGPAPARGAGATTDAPAQGAPSPSPSAVGCPASGAVVDMGPVETAMFHRAVTLTLTNCGQRPYRVRGYPSVRALGDDGERIPVPVNAGGSMFGDDEGPEEVVLRPGGQVTSVLAWVSTQEGGDLIEGDALEIAAAPDSGARVFPLEQHDLRLMDELNTTAWRTDTAG
ncbi:MULTISPECIES: DUF4232 domain-containing protein [unclassified Streptomyces]|uniref:DUF4232 domain-containing protein n=1 Tax=unclassified Streptomyces TaxID=2593676 RepID=UPI0011C8A105|nr:MULTISPECIES: DUF4232 domain-containing protein [unclassified Streptomyces]WSQ80632.1 DUF4232 domain-containing protein [Streptomyces sp. NBC_01213]TXS08341.1 DUF4232 domain-containing protein [Streptomyces sp. wa22]WSQ87964.1 DUF4232 domain-containing protein [Streptomyces sp. NBC_01212]WSR06028.1 DUF4232 domain-containing protein [Streptomyces sp. NBC_01208]WSR51364.1 DUF4232 domain-containing protein [Streptomyces sp. NBC_01201]